jgi:hypothetical protein
VVVEDGEVRKDRRRQDFRPSGGGSGPHSHRRAGPGRALTRRCRSTLRPG